jgi:hypothetical protein
MQVSHVAAGARGAVEPGAISGGTAHGMLADAGQQVGRAPDKNNLSKLGGFVSFIGLSSPDAVPPAIDMWLERNGFNRYGDRLDTVYLGGSPLFNEGTGKTATRLSYILSKHPYLHNLLPVNGGPLNPFISLPPQLFPQMPNTAVAGYQQLQQIMQQMMALLSSFFAALFPRPPHYEMPHPIKIPQPIGDSYPVSPTGRLRQDMGKVEEAIRKLEARIQKYELNGKRAPRGLKRQHRILKDRLTELQKQLKHVTNPDWIGEYKFPVEPSHRQMLAK